MSDMQQPTPPPVAPPPPKRKRPPSRSQRWIDAAGDALAAISEIAAHLDDLETAAAELRAVQEEYEDWKDNLPDNLMNSPLGEKLEEVCGLEIGDAADKIKNVVEEVQDVLETANGIDLPQGFGRD